VTAPDFELPERLRAALAGRYALERELGRGGMGVVYLARDLRHDRPVALKILLPGLAARSGLERFQREILLAARLQHPHILTVLDSGIAGDQGVEQPWYTMPFVDGESLYERLNRERQLPLEDALRIATEAARALGYAHQQGVVHRDVKPENILLTRDGTTLVGDFGIARALGADGDERRLTRTGTQIGSPFYMSPEQTNDAAVDGRTDEYALAAVLFEMLTGEPPFAGRTLEAIVAKRLANPTPSARALRDTVPEHVDAAIRRALARAPDDRYATMGEFARALGALSPGSTGSSAAAAPRASGVTPASMPPAGSRPGRSRAPRVAVAVVLLAGLALFPWRRIHTPPERPDRGVRVVAVLPFDNLGDSADAYFADGVADEIRAKLAQIAGLEVIARGSSLEYRHATRRPNAVAHELGADYLLTGTVRWDKSGGASRVRVLPELVDVRGGGVAHTRWTQQFDASLTDVFQVQADIAGKVVDALGVALADSARRGLAAQPTGDLAAWDAFLQGEEAAQGMKADQAYLRRAIGFYERAVSLDSTFAQAWAQLSRARTSLYSNGVPDQALAEAARSAAERARALRPNDPLAYLAAGDYFAAVTPIDNDRAAAEYERGLRLAPDDVELLSAVAITGARLQQWDGIVPRLERAMRLDPRSSTAARRLATAHIFLRQYARADSAVDRAIALAPTNPQMVLLKVMVELGRGDLAAARSAVRAAAERIDDTTLLAFLVTYQDLYWVLDDAQLSRALQLSPDAFDQDRGVWGIVRAEMHHLQHEERRAAIYADSARLALEAQSRAAPEDAQRHALLGLALAYLGRKAEAIREGRRGVELLPISRDAFLGPYVQLQLVRIYLLTGEPALGLDELERLLRVPFYLSSGWLRVDPTFDPIRTEPGFQRLVSQSR
jgi:eukaryotic-like serine/threonine-protein kinase